MDNDTTWLKVRVDRAAANTAHSNKDQVVNVGWIPPYR